MINDGCLSENLGCLGNVQLDPRTNAIDHAGISFSKGYPTHFLALIIICQRKSFLNTGSNWCMFFSEKKGVVSRDVEGFQAEYKTGFAISIYV